MSRDWAVVDWEQDRPTPGEVAASWTSLRWEPQPLRLPELDRYLREVSAAYVGGGHLVGRWRAVEFSEVTSWFMSRNRNEEYDFLRVFFDDEVVRSGIPELAIPRDLAGLAGSFREYWPGVLGLDGMLANRLVVGGAHRSFRGPASEAKDLSVAAVDALTQRRYADFHMDTSYDAWTPWFGGVVWDSTVVLTDRATCEVTVVCITDID